MCKFDFQFISLCIVIVPVNREFLQLLPQSLNKFGDLQEWYLKYVNKEHGTNQLE